MVKPIDVRKTLVKFDFIDYVHVELVDNDGNYNDIFDILEGDYHLGLAKKWPKSSKKS